MIRKVIVYRLGASFNEVSAGFPKSFNCVSLALYKAANSFFDDRLEDILYVPTGEHEETRHEVGNGVVSSAWGRYLQLRCRGRCVTEATYNYGSRRSFIIPLGNIGRTNRVGTASQAEFPSKEPLSPWKRFRHPRGELDRHLENFDPLLQAIFRNDHSKSHRCISAIPAYQLLTCIFLQLPRPGVLIPGSSAISWAPAGN